MTEFQIVSEQKRTSGNKNVACRYTKFLDEEITVKENSKIYLNHAIFERGGGTYLENSENIQFNIFDEDTFGGGPENLIYVVKEGYYNNEKLTKKMKEAFNEQIALSPVIMGGLNFNYEDNETGFDIGYTAKLEQKKSTTGLPLSGISVGFVYNADTNSITSNIISNLNPNAFYLHPYNLPIATQRYESEKLNDEDEEKEFPSTFFRLVDSNIKKDITQNDIIAKTTSSGIKTKIFMGVYNLEYAIDDTVGTGTRTNSATITNVVVDGLGSEDYNAPTSFFHACLRSNVANDSVYLDFNVAKNNVKGTIDEWDTLKYSIDSMQNLISYDLSTFNKDTELNFDIGFYQDTTNDYFYKEDEENEFNKYYIFINMYTKDTDGRLIPLNIIDSKDFDFGFTKKTLTGLGYGTDIFKRSQMLQNMFSVNQKSFGAFINSKSLPAGASIIRKYNMTLGNEIAKALGFQEEEVLYQTEDVFPNALLSDILEKFVLSEFVFTDDWKNESYCIKLNNFPINTYKTNNRQNKRGYKQAILSVIPTPFSDKSISNNALDNGFNSSSSSYETNFPRILDLKNQEFTTNRFDIEITKLKDDKLATDIQFSAVNFTILDPV